MRGPEANDVFSDGVALTFLIATTFIGISVVAFIVFTAYKTEKAKSDSANVENAEYEGGEMKSTQIDVV